MILQFGAGNFLRAFADLFIDQLNRDSATAVGRVTVVQSTTAGRDRARALREVIGSGRGYPVVIQGCRDGRTVEEIERVTCLERLLVADDDWPAILDAARDPALTVILSNSTEAGYALDPADAGVPDRAGAPRSFPAKLLAALLARHEAGAPGVWVVPCELIENNGLRLRDLALDQARPWQVSPDALDWLRDECRWVNTLVDRIVPGPPRPPHPLLESEPLVLSAEPFALWAVQTDAPAAFPLSAHPAVVMARDIVPYTLRKVRLLNGAHSALVVKARAFPGVATVRDAVEHPEIGPWLEALLFEEIVPVLEGRCEDPAGFARSVLDRFRNPFLEHSLSAIALNHEAKVAVRLQPTAAEFRARFGRPARRVEETLG